MGYRLGRVFGDTVDRTAMTRIDRLRQRSSAPALLVVVLLVALMVGCAFGGEEHTHAVADVRAQPTVAGHSHGAAVVRSASEPAADIGGLFAYGGIHPCGPHILHCLVKSTLPEAAGSVPPPHLLLFLVVLAVIPVIVLGRAPCAVRGPPDTPVSAVSGRSILTRFCIARR